VDLSAWAKTRAWARTWSLFRSLVQEHRHDWRSWPDPLRQRDRAALAEARERHQQAIDEHLALQWLFEAQWMRLRAAADAHGIALWGDLPIFVTADSADVWANPELFRLDAHGRPLAVSGVPPDAFSDVGQLWGHPLFEESAHRASGFAWWTDRLAAVLELVHAVRIDHFRGLESLWQVPADATDARAGEWIPGFGAPLLQAVRDRFGTVPMIAEDLGIITPQVRALRDAFDLPGMAVLQFAFDGSDQPRAAANLYLPHNHRPGQVVYTGTHDNDTSHGWYAKASEGSRDQVRRYLSVDGTHIAWDLLRAAYRSVADTAIVPMQDVLALPGSARMNTPGRAEGNWSWRMGTEAMDPALAGRLRREARISGRGHLPPDSTPVSSPGEDPT
jgi:4-alpha-glucanotransferase